MLSKIKFFWTEEPRHWYSKVRKKDLFCVIGVKASSPWPHLAYSSPLDYGQYIHIYVHWENRVSKF